MGALWSAAAAGGWSKGLLCCNLDVWGELFTEDKGEKTLLVYKINGV